MKWGRSDAFFAQPADHAHSVQAGHVNVQKHHVRLQRFDQFQGFQTVGTCCNYFYFREIPQEEAKLVAGQFFVVNYDCSYGRGRTVAHGSWYYINFSDRREELANQEDVRIAPPEGKLGVLIPGIGAVTTTFIAGLEAMKRGLGKPIGSLTQLGTVRLGKRTEGRTPAIKDFVPLAAVEDLVVGGWDIFEDNAYEAAVKAGVLDTSLLDQVKDPLSAIQPMKAVFDPSFVTRLHGPNVKTGGSKMDYAEMVMDDIRAVPGEDREPRV